MSAELDALNAQSTRLYLVDIAAVMLGTIGYACLYGRSQTGNGAATDGNITASQRQCIDLLAECVSEIQLHHDAKFVGRKELIDSQIDLVNAQFD